MIEIDEELGSLNAQAALAKKNGSQPSPGLKQALATLRNKQENMLLSMDLWRTMLVVCPNYDR